MDRVSLPGRHGAGTAAAADPDTWGLAERIGGLPGVMASCTSLPDGSTATDHFIDDVYVLRSVRSGPQLFCHIDRDGLMLPELATVDKAEIVNKGWASRVDDWITVFLPRDSVEMEISWRIVLLAYRYLTTRPAGTDAPLKKSPILPKCASAAKYWM